MKPGDSVTWMDVVSVKRYSMRFTERQGKVISINGAGTVATVKMRNGREIEMLVSDLRHEGEKGHVTELFEKISSAPAEGSHLNNPDAGVSEKAEQA